MVFPSPASRGTELIPSKPRFGDPWGPLHHRRSPFLGFCVQNPQVVTVKCEQIESGGRPPLDTCGHSICFHSLM